MDILDLSADENVLGFIVVADAQRPADIVEANYVTFSGHFVHFYNRLSTTEEFEDYNYLGGGRYEYFTNTRTVYEDVHIRTYKNLISLDPLRRNDGA